MIHMRWSSTFNSGARAHKLLWVFFVFVYTFIINIKFTLYLFLHIKTHSFGNFRLEQSMCDTHLIQTRIKHEPWENTSTSFASSLRTTTVHMSDNNILIYSPSTRETRTRLRECLYAQNTFLHSVHTDSVYRYHTTSSNFFVFVGYTFWNI